MATFIDNLAFSLFAISFAGLMLLYTMFSMYLAYTKKVRDFSGYLNSAVIPLTLLGAYMIIMGFWGEFTWPLPGAYNILFYDPLIGFGIVLIAFSLVIKNKTRLEYPGFLALLLGAMLVLYGIEGYSIGLTKEPLALLGLYVLYGAVGVLAYPVSLIADRLPGLKKNPWPGWTTILLAFMVLLFLASMLAAYIGFSAIGGHLVSPP
jgi:putative membrane protein